ncbi:MAG: response regulator [Syntrophobacteraceae bacterium]
MVDDDEDFLRLLGEYLGSVGLEHDLAVSAEQARNRLKRSRYDVVVSDFKMPGESGLDLFRYVSYMYPETPFVLITGCDDLRIKRESMRMGVHAYIQKPFYLKELLQTIINLVRRDDQKEVAAT